MMEFIKSIISCGACKSRKLKLQKTQVAPQTPINELKLDADDPKEIKENGANNNIAVVVEEEQVMPPTNDAVNKDLKEEHNEVTIEENEKIV